MEYATIPAVIQGVENYKEKVNKILQGEEDLKSLKSTLGGMGVYQQREKGTFMLRVRIPAGVLQVEWLRNIYEIGKKVGVKRFHLTSRQDIQYHGISLAQTIEVMDALLEKGLVTNGGGGNFPRNIACSPLSGVEQGEVFDVLPYALSSCDYIMENIGSYHLPRKYKVGFSNHESDLGNTTVTDLGFMAREEKGERYFKLYGGGGLGKNPKAGIVLEEKIATEDILYAIKAMLDLFADKGNYENRNKARIRYILEELGEDAFRETYKAYLQKVKTQGEKVPTIIERSYIKKGEVTSLQHKRLIPQKQEGLYSVYVHPFGGYLSLEEVETLLQSLEAIQEVELRLTMNQGFYIINLNGKEAEVILKETEKLHAAGIVNQILSCTGANTCQIGIAPSEELVVAIQKRFEDVDLAIQEALPDIHISGCLNSCGTHQIATLGLCGKIKRVNDAPKTVYTLFINGAISAEGAKLGEPIGDLLAEEVPDFLYELAEAIKAGKITINKEQILEQFEHKFI